MFSLLGALVYLATAALSARAAGRSRGSRDGSRARNLWLAIAGLFVLLAIVRATNLEGWVEASLRSVLNRDGEYQSRHEFQAPLAAALVLMAFALAAAAIRLRGRAHARVGGPLARALTASLAMLILVAVRVASFHGTDTLLYGGPIHLNWVLDLALTGVVAASALSGPKPRRRR